MFIKTTKKIDRTDKIIPLIEKDGYCYYQILDEVNTIGGEEVTIEEVKAEPIGIKEALRIKDLEKEVERLRELVDSVIQGKVEV